MREIKFRIWDKYLNSWSKNTQHLLHNRTGDMLFVILEQGDRLLMEQSTGLRDKNGKEIFEGDIIEKQMSDRPYSSKKKYCNVRSIVKWQPGLDVQDNTWNNKRLNSDPSVFNCEPCFTSKEILNEKGYRCHDWSVFAQCEIIGNIHENPELL